MEYIRHRNKWTEADVESINWQAHGSALRKQIPRRIHFVKLVHDILPTHSWQNKLDSGNRTCPCCASLHEDRDHIVRCPAVNRNSWRHKFLTKLSDACIIHHTYGPLQNLLLEAICQWLYSGTDTPEDNPHSAQYSEELGPLIRAQTRIGWRQLFNGRFCKQWGDVQNAHLYRSRHQVSTQTHSGQKWQVAIITLIWEQWYEVWKLRNDDVHGKDDATRLVAERREVTRQLAAIYSQRRLMEPSFQDLLFPDIQQHLEQPTWVIRNWLTIRAPGFATSIRAATARAIQNVRSIRSYFNPVWETLRVTHLYILHNRWPRFLGGGVQPCKSSAFSHGHSGNT